MSEPDLLKTALPELPLFPLHQAVLFPGSLMPLHVFEPRYRQLVRDVLDSHQTFAIPHVLEPGEEPKGDHPSIAKWAGVGTIVEHAELPGGRFNVVVLGRARVELDELDFVPPYRRAKATILEPPEVEVPPLEVAALTGAATAFAQLVRERDENFKLRSPKNATLGMLIDAYAHQMILSPRTRQQVLETLDLRDRIQIVTEVLTIQRATLSPQDGLAN